MKLSLSVFLGLAASMASAQDLNIIETAADAGTFETLITAVTSTGLDEPLSSEGPFTVFAPPDSAFAAFPPALVECLISQTETLTSVMLYHVVAGQVLSTDLMNGMVVPTLLDGASITIDTTDGVVLNGSVDVENADILTSNGVIHEISGLLIPPDLDVTALAAICLGTPGEEPTETDVQDIPSTAISAGTFTTLVAALGAADLVDPLSAPNGPFTVFAPTDDAFAALPEGLVSCLLLPENKAALTAILTYHVVNGSILSTDLEDGTSATTLGGGDLAIGVGESVTINEAVVVTADIEATNGVIHVIDSVLVPEGIDVAAFLATCPSTDPATDPPMLLDLAGTAAEAGEYNTLFAAVTEAGLTAALALPGPFTVFAPKDSAFSALPDGLLDCLIADSATLTSILSYHVVAGQVLSTDLMDGMTPATLLGETVTVSIGDTVMINDATVTSPDLVATNGVIHGMDSVLVPPGVDLTAYLAACTATETPMDSPTDAPVAAPTDAPVDSGAFSFALNLAAVAVGALTVFMV